MSKLEAKLLGEEKVETYCSSSEDEGASEEDGSAAKLPFPRQPGSGASRNTGPKGVLQDWTLYQQSEKRKLIEKEAELKALCKATALTCLSEREEALRMEETEDELLSDETLKHFVKSRMEQMMQKQAQLPEFGEVEEIRNGEEYLKLIDCSNPSVAVVIHLYETKVPECIRMNECLSSVASNYRRVRFCKIKAANLGVTDQFYRLNIYNRTNEEAEGEFYSISCTEKRQGVPAILVYKGGALIGNFVGLTEEFGSEFYPGDVENYLIENGILEDKANVPSLWAQRQNMPGSAK